MTETNVKYRCGRDYRELFNIMIDSLTCEDIAIGISDQGELLYVKSKLANNSSAYWVQSEFFYISKEEFCAFLKQARENGYLEKALKNGQTTEDELRKLSE